MRAEMTSESYFRRAAFLPIVVPIAVWVIDVARGALIGGAAPSWFGSVADVLLPSLLYFGPLYLGLAAVTLRWLRGKPDWAYCAAALAAPIVMLIAAALAFGDRALLSSAEPIVFWGRLTLTVGYLYCAVGLLGYLIGKRVGWITAAA